MQKLYSTDSNAGKLYSTGNVHKVNKNWTINDLPMIFNTYGTEYGNGFIPTSQIPCSYIVTINIQSHWQFWTIDSCFRLVLILPRKFDTYQKKKRNENDKNTNFMMKKNKKKPKKQSLFWTH